MILNKRKLLKIDYYTLYICLNVAIVSHLDVLVIPRGSKATQVFATSHTVKVKRLVPIFDKVLVLFLSRKSQTMVDAVNSVIKKTALIYNSLCIWSESSER